ncbi:hypothetical protein AAII07_19845 [Microvirga sp. 0TCS3.31]
MLIAWGNLLTVWDASFPQRNSQNRLFEMSLLSCEDVEDAFPRSVKVAGDLLQPRKHGLGCFGIGTLLVHPLDPGDLPGNEPLGLGDVLLQLSEFWV